MNGDTRRLLFLFSDTGGGHRSAANAVAQALQDLYGERAQVELVDVLAGYAPWPLNRPSDLYPHMVRMRGWIWALGYHFWDGPRRVALFARSSWPLVRRAALRLLRDHPADAIISCHSAINHLMLKALNGGHLEAHPPLVTLVTDLIAAYPFWLAPGVTRCLVPTEEARRRALASGLPEDRVMVTGLPVSPDFAKAAQLDQLAIRRRLGLLADAPVVLLTGGGEGMGPVYHLCRAIAGSGIDAQLVVITGRNARLREKLSAKTWPIPVQAEGFVDNMHEWMRAADLLVTKAGPSTISEALVVGLPMVLSGALPGQERPNVNHVVLAGAGIWAPTPRQVAAAVRSLLYDHPVRARMSACARTLAQPEAAHRVAEIVWSVANGELA